MLPPPTGANAQGGAAGTAATPRPAPLRAGHHRQGNHRAGGITVHHVDERYFFEVPDSLLGRDFLLVTRVARRPEQLRRLPARPGRRSASASSAGRRGGDRVILRALAFDAVADDTLPIALSRRQQQLRPDPRRLSHRGLRQRQRIAVIDVTDFFAGDTPALTGLSAAQRRTYGVRRFDPARSFINSVQVVPDQRRSAARADVRRRRAAARSQRAARSRSRCASRSCSCPRIPMRPRYVDPRVGFFSVDRVNYGLDEQKAATQTSSRAGGSSRRIPPPTRAANSSSRSSRSSTTSIPRRRPSGGAT